MPTLIMESSPKFITCPDCGERYDNGRKRRLIDTCGHPRCYSCLFEDNPCPLCEKLPKQRPRTDSSAKPDSDENIDKSQQTGSGSLRKSKDYVGSGSHPNLSNLKEMHKNRSATLPHSFRQDSYFRSLYRYEPHGSTENLSSSRSSSPPTPRPKSMPPSYHKSLENLHEQFWKSVQLAERKWSPAKSSKKNDDEETPTEEEENKTSSQAPASPPPEIVDCPAPNVVRLPVPSSAHSRSPRVLYHHLTADERMNELRQEISRKAQEQKEASRPRSCSDILQPQSLKNIKNDVIDLGTTTSTRPQSWSHIQFPPTSAQGIPNDYRSLSSLSDRSYGSRNSSCSSPPPNSWSPTLHRSASPQYYSSDKSSDVSSIHLSDTCSVSSGDSDSIHSGIRSPSSNKNERMFSIPRPHSALENYSSGSSPTQPPRRFPVNPLANVTYWVVDSGKKSLDAQPGLKETNLDDVIRTRPGNNGTTHAQTYWNGQTKRSPTTVINVQTEVSTL